MDSLLGSMIASRLGFGAAAGLTTFEGKRDVASALGYSKSIGPIDYRLRYERNEVAERIVESLPSATWRGGGELVEDDSPDVVTTFETEWLALADRLGVWDVLRRADILAGLGRYSAVLIGAPGDLKTPLPKLRGQKDVLYLTPYSEETATIDKNDLVTNAEDPRFGRPAYYTLKSTDVAAGTSGDRKIHWTRIFHVADGTLEDNLYGKPRLRSIWNRLDDLDKVVGAGAEAFWQRVQQGLQLKIDKDVELDEPGKAALREEIDEYLHGLRRVARIRGGSLEEVGTSQVSDFSDQVDAIMSLISAGSGIPKRILMGSERGELASQQDRSNWEQRVSDRREQFGAPHVVRPLVDRLISTGALPTPVTYDVRWPSIRNLDDQEIADTAVKWAEINAKAGEMVVTANEIRDRILGLDPLDEQDDVVDPTAIDDANDNPEEGADPSVNLPRAARRKLTVNPLARRFLTKGRRTRRGGRAIDIVDLAQRLRIDTTLTARRTAKDVIRDVATTLARQAGVETAPRTH